MAREKRTYISYLLRLWWVSEAGQSTWRASLDDPRTGERLGFSSLPELFEFLEKQTKECESIARISHNNK